MSLAPRPGSTGPTITLSWRNFYSVIIALLPVVMIYNVPIVNKGLSTILIGITAPFAILAIIRYRNFKPAIIAIVFLSYLMLRSRGDNQNIFLLFMVMLHVIGAFNDSLDFGSMRKTVELVAILGTAFLIIQYFLYYLIGLRFTFLITNFILEKNKHDVLGFVNNNDFFRPAAMFLEPSHYAQYCCIGLLSSLFPLNSTPINWNKSIWISVGIVLTTSGLGIVLVFCIYAYYIVFHEVKKGTRLNNIIIGFTVIVFIVFILFRFPFFKTAVERFTNDSGTTDNAIIGRTLFWDSTVGVLSGKNLIFGLGSLEVPDQFMTGIMQIIYCYGLIGYFLYVLTFTNCAILGKNHLTICMAIMWLGLSLFGNNSNFIQMIFELCLTVSSIDKNRLLLSIK